MCWLYIFIISTGLFIVNGITFVRSYKSDLEIYSTRQAKLWSDRNTTGAYVLKQPNPLEFCVEGNAHIRPQALSIKLDGTISSGWRSEYENFKLPKVRRIDWSFIIQTIYALFCRHSPIDGIQSGVQSADSPWEIFSGAYHNFHSAVNWRPTVTEHYQYSKNTFLASKTVIFTLWLHTLAPEAEDG